jgi:RNA polymerase sigma factor (sigma-70 family)
MNTNEQTARPEDLLAHDGFLAGLVRTLVFDQERAEDYLQDTWAYALARPPKAGPGLKSWLATVARNFIRQDRRSRARRRTREIAAARPEDIPGTEEVVAREGARRRVVDAVLTLAEPYRSTIVLRYLEDLPPREIARRQQVPVETVRTRTKRALALLRTRLDEQSGGDRRSWCVALLPLVQGKKGAVAAAGGAGLIGGILLMSTKSKVTVAAVLLALLLGVGYVTLRPAKSGSDLPVRPNEDPSPIDVARGGDAPNEPLPVEIPPVEAPPEPAPSRPTTVGLRFTDGSGRNLTKDEVLARYRSAGIPLAVTAVPENVFTGSDVSDILRTIVLPLEQWAKIVALEVDEEGLRLAEPLSAGHYRLFLGRPGAAPMATAAFAVEADTVPNLTVPLPDAVKTYPLRFVDGDTGAPLAGTRVTPRFEYGDDQLFLAGPPLLTDGQGRVDLPDLEDEVRAGGRQPTWWVQTDTHLGYLRLAMARHIEPGMGTRQDWPVYRSVTVTGKAYRADGTPAAGCPVVWARKGQVARAVVAEDGSFTLEPVAVEGKEGGRIQLLLIEDLETFKIRDARTTARPGETVTAMIGAPAGEALNSTIAGRVTAGGQPIKGAFVITQTEGVKSGEGFVQTGADGGFEKIDVTPGKVRVQIYLGDPRATDDFKISGSKKIEMAPGNRQVFEFDLPAGAFRVTVVDDETGKPIPGAIALARPENRESGKDRFPGFTYAPGWGLRVDANGGGLLLAMLPGEAHLLRAAADGYERLEITGKLPGTREQPTEVTLRLKKRER